MPREIKFRAWDKINKIMCPPETSLAITFEGAISVITDDGWEGTHYSEGKYKLMQYTGLIDRNCKEIFEGDIIKLPLCNDAIVILEGGCPNYRLRGDSGYYELGNCNSYCFEVIGNIYENPELLEM